MLERLREPALLVLRDGGYVANSVAREASSEADLRQAARAAAEGAPMVERVVDVVHGDAASLVVMQAGRGASLEGRLTNFVEAHRFTPAQQGVLTLLVRGLSNKEIATELKCAPKTVAVHVSGLLARSRCASRQALIASFWQRGDAG